MDYFKNLEHSLCYEVMNTFTSRGEFAEERPKIPIVRIILHILKLKYYFIDRHRKFQKISLFIAIEE